MSRIKEVVGEVLKKTIADCLLVEYSIHRDTFYDRVSNLSIPILIHWCLIRYSNYSHENEIYVEHWKKELRGWMNYITTLKLKKNNSFETRFKLIKQVWDDVEYTTDMNAINGSIIHKFDGEFHNIDEDLYAKTLQDCLNESYNIITLLAKGNIEEIKNYINNL